jgi:hypothetical protein
MDFGASELLLWKKRLVRALISETRNLRSGFGFMPSDPTIKLLCAKHWAYVDIAIEKIRKISTIRRSIE